MGGGGREHALAWKIAKSNLVEEVLCAPGNAGTATVGRNVPIAANDLDGLTKLAEDEGVGLVVIKDGGIPKDAYLGAYCGELYPGWRWFEKVSLF